MISGLLITHQNWWEEGGLIDTRAVLYVHVFYMDFLQTPCQDSLTLEVGVSFFSFEVIDDDMAGELPIFQVGWPVGHLAEISVSL